MCKPKSPTYVAPPKVKAVRRAKAPVALEKSRVVNGVVPDSAAPTRSTSTGTGADRGRSTTATVGAAAASRAMPATVLGA